MPYDHSQVITSITAFYTFLTTHLHFHPSELKTPPPTGWPQINQTRFAFLNKSDKVIDLLRHLPYLPHGEAEKHIYHHTVCADYTHECVDRKQKCPRLSITDYFEPTYEWEEDCGGWEKWKERKEHVAVLGVPEVSEKGCYIFLDTLDGEVAVWDVMDTNYMSFNDAEQFFARVRRWYEEVKLFSTPTEVDLLSEDESRVMKALVASFGWPPAAEVEGSGWRKEEGFREVERVVDAWRRGFLEVGNGYCTTEE